MSGFNRVSPFAQTLRMAHLFEIRAWFYPKKIAEGRTTIIVAMAGHKPKSDGKICWTAPQK